ncbi:hypothetical protein L2E82_17150 [Cichorium intybus]|uniref:Uncharacterized protein n=1 Tax=Cichorium intybus TaxID=13427 RepID=A0ACB9F850_CICIN|nr:hypothetical protein L2E82_17150 [Cichorium intybus]
MFRQISLPCDIYLASSFATCYPLFPSSCDTFSASFLPPLIKQPEIPGGSRLPTSRIQGNGETRFKLKISTDTEVPLSRSTEGLSAIGILLLWSIEA